MPILLSATSVANLFVVAPATFASTKATNEKPDNAQTCKNNIKKQVKGERLLEYCNDSGFFPCSKLAFYKGTTGTSLGWTGRPQVGKSQIFRYI